jgi:hypothetical protein
LSGAFGCSESYASKASKHFNRPVLSAIALQAFISPGRSWGGIATESPGPIAMSMPTIAMTRTFMMEHVLIAPQVYSAKVAQISVELDPLTSWRISAAA